MANSHTITEAHILEKVISPRAAAFSPGAARELLKLKFDARTSKRIRQLLRKNNRGTISARECAVLEKYLRVGQFLDLLHAKARLSLPNRSD